MTDLSLTLRRTINASPEAVYAAWLDPATITRFMAGGNDQKVTEARTDPRVGGDFRIVMTSDKDIAHQGIYRELVPHSLIRFTWDSPYSPADSEVTIRLSPVAEGTEITLTQVKFLSEAAREGHQGGWTRILERLATALETARA
ncbi:MAG: SRPBCC domain-containing protein [Tabrizicola sp.]|nr:SRPBCC domain-containing protein [Tabrizicola sp.]